MSLNLPGYAIIDVVKGKALIRETRFTNNKIRGGSKIPRAKRLKYIADDIEQLLKDYPDIDVVVRERGFSRFTRTTQVLFEVVGVSDLKVYEGLGITKIEEIAPTTVKRLVAGDGKASKDDVAEGVREHLVPAQKNYEFETDDVSDAIAVGISYMIQKGLLK